MGSDPTKQQLGFPGGSEGKESASNVGDLDSIPGWKDPLEEGTATPLQYSSLEWGAIAFSIM